MVVAGLPPARSPPHAVLPRTVPQMLDLKNIQVISQVLAQSVAMDFYSRWVGRKARRGGKRGGGPRVCVRDGCGCADNHA